MLCLRHSGFCQRKVDYISVTFLEVAMNAISNVSMRAIPGTQADVHPLDVHPLDVHPLMTIALLCGLVWAQLSAWRLSAWI
jgi:hypothetical protein